MLKNAGVEIIPVDMPNLEQLNQAISFPVAIYEGKYDLIQYLKDHRIDLTLESVVDQISSPDVQAIFKLNILPELTLDPNGQLVPVLPLYEKAIREARPQLLELYQNTFKAHNLHALLFPTSPIVAPLATNKSIQLKLSRPSCEIQIPAVNRNTRAEFTYWKGAKSKLPVGLEIDGLAHQDSEILAIGITLEKIFKRLNQ